MDTLTFRLSDAAARHLAHILEEDKKQGKSASWRLRISVTGGGCAGFQYVFTFDDTQNKDDHIFEKDRASVIIDDISLGLLNGAELDFIDELIGSSFVIKKNPNASSSCGCGSSFSAI